MNAHGVNAMADQLAEWAEPRRFGARRQPVAVTMDRQPASGLGTASISSPRLQRTPYW